jgi:hypothetical protein
LRRAVEPETRAEAWDGVHQIQGGGVRLFGGFADGQFHVAEPRVVVHQGQVDCETLWHGGLGQPLSDPIAVRFLGDLLADLGQVRRASRMLEVG